MPLGETQRDEALPQHVLHRLTEAEIDPERQRGDELGQPNATKGLSSFHRADRTPLPDSVPTGSAEAPLTLRLPTPVTITREASGRR